MHDKQRKHSLAAQYKHRRKEKDKPQRNGRRQGSDREGSFSAFCCSSWLYFLAMRIPPCALLTYHIPRTRVSVFMITLRRFTEHLKNPPVSADKDYVRRTASHFERRLHHDQECLSSTVKNVPKGFPDQQKLCQKKCISMAPRKKLLSNAIFYMRKADVETVFLCLLLCARTTWVVYPVWLPVYKVSFSASTSRTKRC